MLRRGTVAIGLLALVVVGLGTFFTTRALVFSEEDPVEKAKKATEADNAKPRFRGQIGDFLVIGPGDGTEYAAPCPPPYQPVSDMAKVKASELYSPVFGDRPEAGACADGTIIAVGIFAENVATRAISWAHRASTSTRLKTACASSPLLTSLP